MMNAIAEYRLPAREFALGRLPEPGTSVELEHVVEDGESVVMYFWVDGDAVVERPSGNDARLYDLELLDDVGARSLYRCRCTPEEGSLVWALQTHDVSVLWAAGDDREWQFRLSFPDRNALSAFQSSLVEGDGPGLELEGVYNPIDAATSLGSKLTDRQRVTLLRAYEEGYFDIPRRITLVGLADELGVSDQAVSERMRRGEAKLIRAHLFEEP